MDAANNTLSHLHLSEGPSKPADDSDAPRSHVFSDTPQETQLYSPLDVGKRQVRVMRILPGRRRRIECRSIVIELAWIAFCDALSYAWGDHNDRVDISVNVHTLSVTRNLYNALRCFRKDKTMTSSWIWVDSICINQADVAERGEQVKLMRHIYFEVRLVHVWLGTPDPPTHRLLDKLAVF
jgi:hypothetical protein